jgi:hypothetical protein
VVYDLHVFLGKYITKRYDVGKKVFIPNFVEKSGGLTIFTLPVSVGRCHGCFLATPNRNV